MDCLDPPIAESPPGKWHCPLCPRVGEVSYPPLADAEMVDVADAEPEASPQVNGGPQVLSSDDGSDGTDIPDTSPARTPKSKRRKGKGRATRVHDNSEDDEPHPKPKKQRRLRLESPAPLSRPIVKIRLRIPGRGKAKEEEEKRGLFDDILPLEDRDTVKTSIELSDMSRFERSRTAAEVCLPTTKHFKLSNQCVCFRQKSFPKLPCHCVCTCD
jgi:hypothetical protein